jgi:hypothetical protein
MNFWNFCQSYTSDDNFQFLFLKKHNSHGSQTRFGGHFKSGQNCKKSTKFENEKNSHLNETRYERRFLETILI